MTSDDRRADAAVVEIDRLRAEHWGSPAVDGVSFTVRPGDIYVLLGRNGSGKSSLLSCVLGVHRPSGGAVRVFGKDPWRERVAVLGRVGVVPEAPNAPADLTARQLAAFVRRLHRRWDDDATAQRLERFGVPASLPFGRLSKGQQGAVMLSLALGHSPELLVLDDPTLGLDIVAKDEIFAELIGELADRGTTVLMTTHELALAEGLASHVGILAGRSLVLGGEVEQLKQQRGESLEQIYRSCVAGQGRAA